ncbi:MAG: cobalt-precorrin-6A reductase [Selenomonadaceae bacterium]|nr:cobalt-precorrin-6A reductase [Selenomonadaceae bacterium]
MILLLAGTKDGRELGETLSKQNYRIIISVTSDYGKKLIKKSKNLVINDKPMDLERLVSYIKENKVKLLIDASHPYAETASKNAIAAANEAKIPYIRYEREKAAIDYDKVYYAKDYEDAAKISAGLGNNIFFTTGSKSAKFFFNSPLLKDKRLIFRVLPSANVLSELTEAGILAKNIVALEGPFTEELNRALFKAYEADAIITKDGGNVGGTDTKTAAAKNLDLPMVIIERPKIDYPNVVSNYNAVFEFVRNCLARNN